MVNVPQTSRPCFNWTHSVLYDARLGTTPPMLNTLAPPVSADHPIKDYVFNLRSNIQVAWDSATSVLSKYHSRSPEKLNKSRKRFDVPLGSLVYVRLPPNKGQSQRFQSFNSGLWKLQAYDPTSNNCTVTTKSEGPVRREDVHAQYVFPFTGTPEVHADSRLRSFCSRPICWYL